MSSETIKALEDHLKNYSMTNEDRLLITIYLKFIRKEGKLTVLERFTNLFNVNEVYFLQKKDLNSFSSINDIVNHIKKLNDEFLTSPKQSDFKNKIDMLNKVYYALLITTIILFLTVFLSPAPFGLIIFALAMIPLTYMFGKYTSSIDAKADKYIENLNDLEIMKLVNNSFFNPSNSVNAVPITGHQDTLTFN